MCVEARANELRCDEFAVELTFTRFRMDSEPCFSKTVDLFERHIQVPVFSDLTNTPCGRVALVTSALHAQRDRLLFYRLTYRVPIVEGPDFIVQSVYNEMH